MKRAVGLLLLLASACVPGEGPSMRPFEDCVSCHGGGGDARSWTAAGTWSRGAHVTVVDANGKSVPMRGNDVGNFYTAEGLTFPLTVSVDGVPMPTPVTYGGCNVCHRGATVTTGPLMAPGADCLTCHGPGGMATAKFSAAGTWAGSPPGTAVRVGSYTTTTNAVGNFIFCASGTTCRLADGTSYGTAAPITSWPQAASVGGSRMSPDPTYGGCNRCHGLGGGAGGD